MILTDKVEYKGKWVNFYQLEYLVLKKYGGWDKVPKESEANIARKKFDGMSDIKTEKEEFVYPKVQELIESQYVERDPLRTVRYNYKINKYKLSKTLEKANYNQKHLSLSMGLYKNAISNAKSKWGDDELVDKLLIVFPHLSVEDLVLDKWPSQRQVRFNVKKEIFDMIQQEDIPKIFSPIGQHSVCKKDKRMNPIHLNAIHKLYGIKHEEMIDCETKSKETDGHGQATD